MKKLLLIGVCLFSIPSSFADSIVEHGPWSSFTLSQGDYVNGCAIIGDKNKDISIRLTITDGVGVSLDLAIRGNSYIKNDNSFSIKYGDKTRYFDNNSLSINNNVVNISNDIGVKSLSELIDDFRSYKNSYITISSNSIKTTNMFGLYKNNTRISLFEFDSVVNDFFRCVDKIKEQQDRESK